jgi:hypothetical protein
LANVAPKFSSTARSAICSPRFAGCLTNWTVVAGDGLWIIGSTKLSLFAMKTFLAIPSSNAILAGRLSYFLERDGTDFAFLTCDCFDLIGKSVFGTFLAGCLVVLIVETSSCKK